MTGPSWDEAYAGSAPAAWDKPGNSGPRRVRQDELYAAFGAGWRIASIEAAAFELNQPGLGIPFAQAWLAVIQRVGQG